MEDPAMLERLAALLPPPPAVAPTDWAAVEAELGTALPEDFKAFGDRWGLGSIEGSAFTIELPTALGWMLEDLAFDMPEEDARPLHPDAGGLLPWGSTESTKWFLCWETSTWTVVAHTMRGFVDTGLGFGAWLVGALEASIPAEHVPGEIWIPPDDPPAGLRGHRWYAGTEPVRRRGDSRPEEVVRSCGFVGGEYYVSLDLGGVLGIDRERALALLSEALPAELAATIKRVETRPTAERVVVSERAQMLAVAGVAGQLAADALSARLDATWLEKLGDQIR